MYNSQCSQVVRAPSCSLGQLALTHDTSSWSLNMPKTDEIIWGMHAGKTGDANSLFLYKNRIALGWDELGDLNQIEPDREAFKNRVAKVYPELSPGARVNSASQLFRFIHELKIGDLVCYPSKADRQIHIGRVSNRR